MNLTHALICNVRSLTTEARTLQQTLFHAGNTYVITSEQIKHTWPHNIHSHIKVEM